MPTYQNESTQALTVINKTGTYMRRLPAAPHILTGSQKTIIYIRTLDEEFIHIDCEATGAGGGF